MEYPSLGTYDQKRKNRWYFGGVASAAAACCTHPLDLLKVLLQTQEGNNSTLRQLITNLYKNNGVSGFYNGLSASLVRQLTANLTRFAIYETFKVHISDHNVHKQLALASVAGAIGAVVGSPADVTNVRMQNDMRLPVEKRRNYKHIVDGITRIIKEEGFKNLFNGSVSNMLRGAVMTMSANVVYDQAKLHHLRNGFQDNLTTHLTSSSIAGVAATTATQPIDVIKTRMMNAKSGEFKGILDVVKFTAQQGPQAFFKGYIPSFIRITPHAILTFVFMEQLRLRFGYFLPPNDKK